MKKPILLITSLCFAVMAMAQNKHLTDSLLHALTVANTDIKKIGIYNTLSQTFTDPSPEKAMEYANKALALSRQAKYPIGEGDALYNRALIFENMLKLDSAVVNCDEAIRIHKGANDINGLADDYFDKAVLFRKQGKTADAMPYFQLAADIYEKTNNLRGSATSLVSMANNYNKLYVFDKALALYQKAYALRVKNKDTLTAAQTLVGIGITYRNMQEILAAHDVKFFKLAISNMLTARKVFIKLNNKLSIALVDREAGMTYVYNNAYRDALVYLLEGEATMRAINYKRELGLLYKNIGECYLHTNQYPQAKIAFEKAIESANAEKYLEQIEAAYGGMYDYYKTVGDSKNALLYHEKWMTVKDSVYSRDNFNKLSDLTTKYETEKKEQQISILNKENTIQKLSINKRNTTIGIIAALFVLTGLMVFLLSNRNKHKQRAITHRQMLDQQDILTKAVIEAEEKERKRIASDLHDGVGQLFSAVKMNLTGLFDRIRIERDEERFLAEKTLALVDESCKEVRVISHQMMPNMLLRSGIASDVKSFIEKIDSESLKVSVEANGFKNKIESNVETVLYRVIQETVNNVIKHSKASKLDIILNRDPDGIYADITDNGVGFNTALLSDFEGIGLKNIATRIEYLKGTVKFESEPGRGTSVKIWVPVA